MFVLRTVRVNLCSEGAVSTNNINGQPILSHVMVHIYPSTRRLNPESHNSNILAIRRHTCDAARFFFIQRADSAKHKVKENGYAILRG